MRAEIITSVGKGMMNMMATFTNIRKSSILVLILGSIAIFLATHVSRAASGVPPCPYNTCSSGQSCRQWDHDDPGSLCCVTVCDADSLQTNFYPSFPKVMRHGAGHPQSNYSNSYDSDGATPWIFSQYDAVKFSTGQLGAVDEGRKPQNLFAEEIKWFDPSTIVLGIRESIWNLPDDVPQDYMGSGSYYAHQPDGEIPLIYRNPFPNYTKIEAGEYAISNANKTGYYDSLTSEDFRFFDGVFFPDSRSGFAPYDLCVDWPNIDFDENGIPDTQEYGNTCAGAGNVDEINRRWRDGYDSRLLEERQTGILLSGKSDWKIVINDGGPPAGAQYTPLNSTADFMKEVVDGFSIENAPEWNGMREILMDWDDNGKKPSLVSWVDTIGPGRWYEAWIGDNQNDFATMRFHLATTMLGDAYYGRCVGEGNMVCFWYDEFEADLGQPIGDKDKEPVELTQYCINPCPGNWGCAYYCPYVRFFERGAIILNPIGEKLTITDDDLRAAWQKAGLAANDYPGYYRFSGGQDPVMNNGEPFTSVTLSGAHTLDKNGVRELASGDAVLLVTQPNIYHVSDILVGNCNHDDTSPGSEPVELSGKWVEEWDHGDIDGKGNPYFVQYLANWLPDVCEKKPSMQCSSNSDCVNGSEDFGPCVEINNGYAAKYTTEAGAIATFRPTIGLSGEYHVYEWHGWRGSYADSYQEVRNVQVEIRHAQGSDLTTVSQRVNYGQWNYLGTYTFHQGTDGYVKFTYPGGGDYMIADVVMFQFAGGAAGPKCDSDLNRDGDNNVLDIQVMVNALLGDIPEGLCADLNSDGKVDTLDLEILVQRVLGF
ncbi:MAG: hypothetical protein A2Z14_05735 [Chloroflexi bacterium RBG_16_48_8]|nr:MAG: hypothetical protein A2Z14_05735 [Chloroflexi bacterium RBG_16_48_8]